MAANTAQIISFLDDLLDADAYSDYGPNGLQVPGSERVEKVVTGVSAHAELHERAAAAGADLVLTHHGLFWSGQPLEITPVMHRRLKPLFEHQIALAAYHLPLDAHEAHGNNALLANAIRADQPHPFADHDGRHIGVQATFSEPISLEELVSRVRDVVGGREPLVVSGGPEQIRSIGIVSGAGTDYVDEALESGLDAFLTGEPSERAYGIANDGGIHFIAAGHHATETLGIRRLGDLLAREFGVEHEYIDIPNPI